MLAVSADLGGEDAQGILGRGDAAGDFEDICARFGHLRVEGSEGVIGRSLVEIVEGGDNCGSGLVGTKDEGARLGPGDLHVDRVREACEQKHEFGVLACAQFCRTALGCCADRREDGEGSL